jgi:hypothetical protein
MKPWSVAMETQEWVPFTSLSSFNIFLTAVNNINIRGPSGKVPDIIVRFLSNLEFSTDFLKSSNVRYENRSSSSSAGTYAQRDRQTYKRFLLLIRSRLKCVKNAWKKITYAHTYILIFLLSIITYNIVLKFKNRQRVYTKPLHQYIVCSREYNLKLL